MPLYSASRMISATTGSESNSRPSSNEMPEIAHGRPASVFRSAEATESVTLVGRRASRAVGGNTASDTGPPFAARHPKRIYGAPASASKTSSVRSKPVRSHLLKIFRIIASCDVLSAVRGSNIAARYSTSFSSIAKRGTPEATSHSRLSAPTGVCSTVSGAQHSAGTCFIKSAIRGWWRLPIGRPGAKRRTTAPSAFSAAPSNSDTVIGPICTIPLAVFEALASGRRIARRSIPSVCRMPKL